jgi:hypothetical protein
MTTHPDLAAQWNYSKNNGLEPDQVTAGSEKRVWWICSKGHEWQAKIRSRSARAQGCPYCSGRYAIKGENDLATLRPDLIKY